MASQISKPPQRGNKTAPGGQAKSSNKAAPLPVLEPSKRATWIKYESKNTFSLVLVGPGGLIKQMTVHKAFSAGSEKIEAEDWVLSTPLDYNNYRKYAQPSNMAAVLKARKKFINQAFTSEDKGITFAEDAPAKYSKSSNNREDAIRSAKEKCIQDDYNSKMEEWNAHRRARQEEGKTAKAKPKRNANVPRSAWLDQMEESDAEAEKEYKKFLDLPDKRKAAIQAHPTPSYENDGNGLSKLQTALPGFRGKTVREVEKLLLGIFAPQPQETKKDG